MKSLSRLFSVLMLMMLFLAPVVQMVFQEDSVLVLEEFEDSDAEDGEDIEFKDHQEKFFYSHKTNNPSAMVLPSIQLPKSWKSNVSSTQRLGVETPPPELT